MCQSTIYLKKGDTEEEILRDAILVESCSEGIKIQGLFDDPKIIPARITSIDLLKNRIILEITE
jgi:predicted RNA-binding protein|nr:CooT family nickel-binding protein [Deltaproteobacteria bacterium]